jgi:HEAT repeat protein
MLFAWGPGLGKQRFDKKIEAIEALRQAPESPARSEQLRKALKDRNNFLVAKAAGVAAHLGEALLIPDLLTAFDRFLIDATKSDPQCWAKNAIAKTLKDLGHNESDVFLRGIVHVQLEPVWGGRQDSAAVLRGTCALALVECRMDDVEILGVLAELLADPQKPARLDAARAIAQLGRMEGVPLLRLKTLCGDEDPEVIGECFLALSSLNAAHAVAFIARFLESPDADVRMEALSVLGQSAEPAALETLKSSWSNLADPELRRALLLSLAASPLRDSAEFVLAVLEDTSGLVAESAIVSLARSRFRAEVFDRAATIVKARGDNRLEKAFEKEFGSRV